MCGSAGAAGLHFDRHFANRAINVAPEMTDAAFSPM
jgi:hypothetical protein